MRDREKERCIDRGRKREIYVLEKGTERERETRLS